MEPLIVIAVLGYSEAVVGIVFALSGLAGMGAALAFGRLDTRGREWRLLVLPMLAGSATTVFSWRALLMPVGIVVLVVGAGRYLLRGNPRSILEVPGSGQREVTILARV